MKEPVVLSWSGGKDSAMALHELLGDGTYEVVSLLTTVSDEFRRISHHGVRESLLDEQAKAIGIPVRKAYLPSGAAGGCTNEVYESIMKEVMLAYYRDGIRIVAFGDLFLQDLRDWRQANLAQVGMRGIFPVWNPMTGKFARDVIALGYKALLSCVEGYLGLAFGGREYDEELLSDLPPAVDPCGENGEFHTFVYDGPIFHRPLPVRVREIVKRDGRYYADLTTEPRSAHACQV
ncbi:MAG: ATP-binding protein [Verrucomicrobiota bacterium]|nr:ATP-binding protein [Verrucomicrobiota bacterium]